MKKYTHDLIILGGGAAGLSAASGCAQLGMKVALIEPHKTGGDCLYHGCVPSKTLIRSAAAAQAFRDWERFGIEFPESGLGSVGSRGSMGLARTEGINDRIRKVIQTIEPNDSPERFRGLGVEVFEEAAVFEDAYSLRTTTGVRVSAKKILLATGSRPRVPPIPGLAEVGYITNLDVFSLEKLPPSLITLGGGPIGIELSQSLARLGVKVTIIEAALSILPREDADLSKVVHARLEEEGITIQTGRLAVKVESPSGDKNQTKKRVILDDGNSFEADEILVAIGRIGNTENLEIEKAGVRVERGFFPVDDQLRTNKKHILAIGDCNGQYLFTPVAGAEGSLAVRKFALGLPGKISYSAVPWVTYCEPELASVGLNEQAAKTAGLSFQTLVVEMGGNDRALAEGETAGRAKFLIDPKQRVIGVQLLGPHAGEMLLPGVFAVKERWKIGRFLGPLYPYPTVSEVYKRVAGQLLGPKLFNPRVRKILRLLKGFRGSL
ncbi:MAG: FAD-dependent oxidoreductase [Spirochaetales bacterium]|nr:FAD-dependent oxidoreductase [Spirochaetales bacterium]